MVYHIIPKEDYNKELKFDGNKILCYSKKQLEDIYPDEDSYIVVGETKKKNKKNEIAKLAIEDEEYIVSAFGGHNWLTYRKAGFVCVGTDQYVAILKFRFLFIILFIKLLIGMILLGWLLGNLLRPAIKPTPKPTATPKPTPQVVDPLHPLPTVDPNEKPIGDDDSQKPDVQDGGGTVNLHYNTQAKLKLSTGEIEVRMLNPNASTHDLVMEMNLVNGDDRITIAKSGRVRSAYGVDMLKFIKDSVILKEGVYECEYVLTLYDPKTGEAALVAPKVENVTLTVTP